MKKILACLMKLLNLFNPIITALGALSAIISALFWHLSAHFSTQQNISSIENELAAIFAIISAGCIYLSLMASQYRASKNRSTAAIEHIHNELKLVNDKFKHIYSYFESSQKLDNEKLKNMSNLLKVKENNKIK
ncbi:TPA: hypothetical protein SMN08_001325 [Proteus mirabilis]|nr:hypothetical protein [Proteus mirabilis]